MYEFTNQPLYLPLGTVEEPPAPPADTTTTISQTGPWMLEAPTALQAFSIISGLTGAAAGFLLAQRMGDYTRVSTSQILMATALSFVGTFAAAFVIRTIEEWPSTTP